MAPHVWYLKYPEKIKGRGTFDYFLEELRYFKQYLERLSGVELTDERLSHAISVYNEHYDLMRALREARKQNPPPVSGHDAWQIEFASLLMPKDEHNKYLRVYLDRLPQRQGKPKEAVRLYLGPACAMDQVSAVLYDIIERCGGQVVSEDISWGTSYHWTKIATDVEPLQAIAAHRLDIHCPRSTVDDSIPEHRFEHIKQTIEGYDVRGAIFYNTPYCECRATENPHIRDRFRDEYNLPVLFLDGAYPPEGLQQLRNRIQAFIEMVSG